MPERIQVSPANPDKVVFNGVDLVNQEELSSSQQRELQRYIEENAHLLQFGDKPKPEEPEVKPKPKSRYADALTRLGQDGGSKRSSQYSLHSPAASDYGTGKRKEVSWYDGVRARSHSPTSKTAESGYGSMDSMISPRPRAASPTSYSTTDRRRVSQSPSGYGYDSMDRTGSAYGGSIERGGSAYGGSAYGGSAYGGSAYGGSIDRSERRSRMDSPWKPFGLDYRDKNMLYGSKDSVKSTDSWHKYIPDRKFTPAYSSFQKHRDDYTRARESRSGSRENEPVRFYGYGDRVGSGIELTPKRWAGGEIITDPNFIKKSLKPRRLFYSPIGDGVVEADGVEMKRVKDMSIRRYVTHERYLEGGHGPRDGLKITEKRWVDGDDRGPSDDGPRFEHYEEPQKIAEAPKYDAGPTPAPKYDAGPTPAPRPRSPLRGWTLTYIANPRELVNQYGTETNTTIFDLKDHTPKKYVVTKEWVSRKEAGPEFEAEE